MWRNNYFTFCVTIDEAVAQALRQSFTQKVFFIFGVIQTSMQTVKVTFIIYLRHINWDSNSDADRAANCDARKNNLIFHVILIVTQTVTQTVMQ